MPYDYCHPGSASITLTTSSMLDIKSNHRTRKQFLFLQLPVLWFGLEAGQFPNKSSVKGENQVTSIAEPVI